MRFLLLLLGLGLTLGAEPALALQTGLAGYVAEVGVDARAVGLHCDFSTDDTATLRGLFEGGVLAGKKLWLPSGCVLLLGTPGASDSVVEFPTNSTIEGADASSGFILARQACSGVSDTPGAACTASNQCTNGTCVADSGGPFAGTSSSNTFTVFSAASGATNVTLKNFGIWVNGASGASLKIGGAGKKWGICDGAGTSVASSGCSRTCDSGSSAGLEGLACNANATCSGSGSHCSVNLGSCASLGGACNEIPYTTPWAASGAGKINVIDLSNASFDLIQGITVYDHRRGDFTFKTGIDGVIEDSRNDGNTLTTPQVATNGWGNYRPNASVDKGLIASFGEIVTRTTTTGWTAGLNAMGGNYINGAIGTSLGLPTEATWPGTTGLLISGAGVTSDGFVGLGGVMCVLPEINLGLNFIMRGPYCDGQTGPKFVVQSSGNQYVGVRGAWGGAGSVVSLGDPRGRCAGGARSGRVCVFGADVNATIGCPSSTCNPHADFKAGSVNHFLLEGGLLHTDASIDKTKFTYIRTTDGLRCQTGTDLGKTCTTSADCASTAACDYNTYVNGLVDGLVLYDGAGQATGIDVSTGSVGVNAISGPSIQGWVVNGVNFNAHAIGMKFPTLARKCWGGGGGGNNNGTSCAADATCTGTGAPKCGAPVQDFVASSNMAQVTTPLSGWDWSYGDVSNVKGLTAADDQGQVVTLTAGAALTRGQVVSVSSAAANTVIVTTTANPERAIGIVLATTLSGYPAKILTSGAGVCVAQGTITAGDLLKPSGSTAGSVATVSGSSDLILGSALASATNTQTFRCSIGTPASMQNTTQTFPKFDKAEFASTVSFSTCTTNTQVTSLTYTATSGRLIRLHALVPVDQTTAATRTATITLKRGGSTCDAGSPATLATANTALTSTTNQGSAVLDITDTGQSGSVTYRLCACSTGAGTQADANSAIHLTEY